MYLNWKHETEFTIAAHVLLKKENQTEKTILLQNKAKFDKISISRLVPFGSYDRKRKTWAILTFSLCRAFFHPVIIIHATIDTELKQTKKQTKNSKGTWIKQRFYNNVPCKSAKMKNNILVKATRTCQRFKEIFQKWRHHALNPLYSLVIMSVIKN